MLGAAIMGSLVGLAIGIGIHTGLALVAGATMANFTALVAARRGGVAIRRGSSGVSWELLPFVFGVLVLATALARAGARCEAHLPGGTWRLEPLGPAGRGGPLAHRLEAIADALAADIRRCLQGQVVLAHQDLTTAAPIRPVE